MKRKNRLTGLAPLALLAFLNGCDKRPETPAHIAPKTWNLAAMTAPVGAPVEYTTVGSVVSDQRVEVARSAIAQAEENLRVVRDRYANGLSTHTEVLDAETLRANSEANHAAARYDAVLAGLRLKRAVGDL